ncbi:DNA-binding SARP family transcriptional activator [Saccharothrix australiensis]|uniref:DNA-binding SARP family transcriptional activator n=1 Tax=Saccharothrix australiensis TaxID=2072 RepID=A0A495VZU6_9PSEU|nr:DNA-binding SARP family transcriptional activator [Saccharothrix australiensis]
MVLGVVMAVWFRLWGGVEAEVDGVPLDLGPAKQRGVLAVLLVEANRVVPADLLLDRLWGGRPPHRARSTLYSYLSRLRAVLSVTDEARLVRRSGGYQLTLDEQRVDLHRSRHLVARARAADDERAVALLEQALELWRGEPLAGLDSPWAEGLRVALDGERLAAELDHADVALRRGRHAALLPGLADRARRHPLDERIAAQLMLALCRGGRQADALEHYRRLRARLVDELGTDPGTHLQQLYQRILTADPDLVAPAAVTARSPVAPRQLPAAPALFTGRAPELAELDRIVPAAPLDGPAGRSDTHEPAGAPDTRGPGGAAGTRSPDGRHRTHGPDHAPGTNADDAPGAAAPGAPPRAAGHPPPTGATVVISAIGGAGGIGKTWLALAWANRHRERFSDGQLFVDLRGFSPTGEPMTPGEALRGFLDALGVSPDRVPHDLDARAALYRSLTAERRMLVVLDNAAAVDQVAPLLPGGTSCTVLVTSRNRLPALVARHGARPLSLDVLTDTESRALLTAALGAARVAAEEPAAADLVRLCGGFPLALAVIAARAAAEPHLPLAETVAELRAFGVDALDDSDPTASLPAVLSWSLRRLTEPQRTAFALLGIAPGPDTGLPAAADLVGASRRETRAVLRALADASLLERTPGDRYAMHDLVRAYAATRAHDTVPEPTRDAALTRVVDFYLHTAHTAQRLFDPHVPLIPPGPPAPGVHPHPLPDQPTALAWLDAEHPHLLAAQQTAVARRRHHTAWHLAWNLTGFYRLRGHLRDDLAAWRAALEAAEHLPDPTTRIRALRNLGRAHSRLGGHEEATAHLHRALALAERHRDTGLRATIHHELAVAWERRGDDRKALDHARHTLELHRTLDNPVWEARALNSVGWHAARLGDHDTARAHCRAALVLFRRHHNPDGEAATLDSLGYIHYHTRRHHLAVHYYHQALALYRSLGNTYETANTLDNLGRPQAALGRRDRARAVWREALELYREQGRHADAHRVRRRLDGLDDTAAGGPEDH